MCDVYAAHGDRAAVDADVDAQGSSIREDETHFPLCAKVECHAFVLERFVEPEFRGRVHVQKNVPSLSMI